MICSVESVSASARSCVCMYILLYSNVFVCPYLLFHFGRCAFFLLTETRSSCVSMPHRHVVIRNSMPIGVGEKGIENHITICLSSDLERKKWLQFYYPRWCVFLMDKLGRPIVFQADSIQTRRLYVHPLLPPAFL